MFFVAYSVTGINLLLIYEKLASDCAHCYI